MEQKIKNEFKDSIVSQMIAHFELEKEPKFLGGFESYIYKASRGNTEFILRISHSLHRSKAQLIAELKFLHHLRTNEIDVPEVFKSSAGEFVVSVETDTGYFSGCLFEFVQGEKAERSIDIAEKIGEFMGKMHQASSTYIPVMSDRPDFFGKTQPLFDFIPDDDKQIKATAIQVISKIKQIPKLSNNYGLIHSDFHFENFFVRGGNITLFDFDDCQSSWFVHDVAMTFFYYLPHTERGEKVSSDAHRFLSRLLKGYRRHFVIENEMLSHIEDFLKVRELELYSLIHRSFDLDNLSDFPKSFMVGRKENLLADKPYFPVDLEQL